MTDQELAALMNQNNADREYLEELQEALRAERAKPAMQQNADEIRELTEAIALICGSSQISAAETGTKAHTAAEAEAVKKPVRIPREPSRWARYASFAAAAAACLLVFGGFLGLMERLGQKPGAPTSAAEQTESAYDPFAVPPHIQQSYPAMNAGFSFGLTELPDGGEFPFSDAVSLPMMLQNSGDDAGFRLFVFADGILQDVRLAQDGMTVPNSLLYLRSGEQRRFDAVFRPVTAGAKPAALTYALMLDPGFSPESETAMFGHHYSMMSYSAFTLAEGYAEKQDDIAAQAEQQPVQGSSSHAEFEAVTSTAQSVRHSDSVTLTLKGDETPGKWRVSAYCGQNQAAAFDGKHYLDMTADAQTGSTYTVSLADFPACGQPYSAVYFIAVPLDGQHELMRSYPIVLVNDDAGETGTT